MFRFRFDSSHCIHRRRMRTYQHTASTLLERCDILDGRHKSDAGVGSGRRRRFWDLCGFRFPTTFWNGFLIDLRDSVVFSVVQSIMELERIGWVQVRLEIQSVWCFVFDFILHTAYTIGACALTSILPPLSLIDWYIVWRTQKRRRRRFRASASIFRLMWISLLHNVAKRVRNRTVRFRCVFGSKHGPLNVRRILRKPSLMVVTLNLAWYYLIWGWVLQG
jgi:hypothetical protein